MPRPTIRRRPSQAKEHSPSDDADSRSAPRGERLQKLLAAAGLGSRRQCEQLILSGRVEVDREFVMELGVRVDPASQDIRVDGAALPKPKRVYYLVHKPQGVLCTNRDPSGRPRVIDMLPPQDGLFTVGRLDMSSEGAILVTNDGELANRLTHPRYGIPKTYQVLVSGKMEPETLQRLRNGFRLAEAFVRVADIRIRGRHKNGSQLEVVLREGRNREIRRMLAAVGHKVQRLKRIAMGPLRLGELPAGAFRTLDPREVRALRAATREQGDTGAGSRTGRRRPPRKKQPPRRKQAPHKKAAAAEGSKSKRGAAKQRPPGKGATKRKPAGSAPRKRPTKKTSTKRPTRKTGGKRPAKKTGAKRPARKKGGR